MKPFNLAIAMALMAPPLQGAGYSDGVFILNEDWFGHNNSTLNFWNYKERTVDYLLIKNANRETEGINSLGCTSQYAQIYGNRLYAMSKQNQDSGENTYQGGRFVVVDTETMLVKAGFKEIAVNSDGQSIADGRCCVAVNPSKIYLGSSNGIYIYDTGKKEISPSPILGTENEMIKGGELNTDGLGALYNNQIGMMLRGQDFIFAIKQDHGILVIDPETDTVVKTIPGCFSTMTQSADGNIWAGMNVAQGSNENGISFQHYPYGNNGEAWQGTRLICIDQYSLDQSYVDLNVGGVPQSWYAWTAGPLASHPRKNRLYYIYSDPSVGQPSWFSIGALYRYDIDTGIERKVCDISEYNIHFYSSGLRVSPVDGLLYGFFYSGGISSNVWGYTTIEDDDSDELVTDNEQMLISNYWYPALVIFPDNEAPQVSNPGKVTINGTPVTVNLADLVSDTDTPPASIVKHIVGVTGPDVVDAVIERGNLVINGLAPGHSDIEVEFDSNGCFATATINVEVVEPSGLDTVNTNPLELRLSNGALYLTGTDTTADIAVYSPVGALLRTDIIIPGTPLMLDGLSGPVIITVSDHTQIITSKFNL